MNEHYKAGKRLKRDMLRYVQTVAHDEGITHAQALQQIADNPATAMTEMSVSKEFVIAWVHRAQA